MPVYADTDGDSSVVSYETGDDWIEVTFSDRFVYTYTNESAGAENVSHMKQLAAVGNGLNSFIMTHVRHRYASKR